MEAGAMQGHTPEFELAHQGPHRAISRCDVIFDGKVVNRLSCHTGSVKSDRLAAQRGQFDVEVADPDGTLAPVDMTSDLAPFGPRVQLYSGARLDATEFTTLQCDARNGWSGQLVSMTVDEDGALTLGP